MLEIGAVRTHALSATRRNIEIRRAPCKRVTDITGDPCIRDLGENRR